MTLAQVALASELVLAGADIVTAIVRAVFTLWPCTGTPGQCADNRTLCPECARYVWDAPENIALDEFRQAVGTRVLGAWSRPDEPPDSWSSTHTREEAVVVLDSLVR